MINLTLYLQDDFLVWEAEPTGKGKERHLFLFDDKLMLTKKRKPKAAGEPVTYEFKSLVDVSKGNGIRFVLYRSSRLP